MKPYTVNFIADHFSMFVSVELDPKEDDLHGATDDEMEEVAIDLARKMMLYHYGIDIAKLSDTTEVVAG